MDEDLKNKRDGDRIRAQLDILLNLIEQESSSFLGIGSLAVALIVILSLDKNLILLRPIEGKILLTIFLCLIIFTLGTRFYFLSRGKKKSMNIIEEIMGKKISNEIQMSTFEKIIAYIPITVTTIFFICISYIIYVLWR